MGRIVVLPFGTTRTAELSALRSYRTLPPREFVGTHLCQRLSGPQGCRMRTRLHHLNIFKDPVGNITTDLPSCGACISYVDLEFLNVVQFYM